MSVEKEFYYRSNPRMFANTTRKMLRYFVNLGWSKITEVRLTRGDKEAEECEGALRILEEIGDEMQKLTW